MIIETRDDARFAGDNSDVYDLFSVLIGSRMHRHRWEGIEEGLIGWVGAIKVKDTSLLRFEELSPYRIYLVI